LCVYVYIYIQIGGSIRLQFGLSSSLIV